MKNKKNSILLSGVVLILVLVFSGCDQTDLITFDRFEVNGSTLQISSNGSYEITSLNNVLAYIKINDKAKVKGYILEQTEYPKGDRETSEKTTYKCYSPQGSNPYEKLKNLELNKDYKLKYTVYSTSDCSGDDLGYKTQWFYTYNNNNNNTQNPTDDSPLSPQNIKAELEDAGVYYYKEDGSGLVDCRDEMEDIEENKAACYAYTQVGKSHSNCCEFTKWVFGMVDKSFDTCYTSNFSGYSKTNNISHTGLVRWGNKHMGIIYKSKSGVWKVVEANISGKVNLTELENEQYVQNGSTTYYKSMT